MINVNFIGRLGANAEEKTSQSGNKFLTMNIAVDNYHKGEKSTIWVRVAAVGDRNLKLKEYFTKGRLLNVVGVLQVGTYVNKDGETVVSYDVNADRIDFVSIGSGGSQSNEASSDTVASKEQANDSAPSVVTSSQESNDVDDLPF